MKKSKKATQKQCKQLIKDYHSGKLSKEHIVVLERLNNKPIDKIISDLEKDFEIRKYSLPFMNVTDARKLLKIQNKLSLSEINKYEQFNQCSFTDVLKEASNIVSTFEARKEKMHQENNARQKQRSELYKAFSIDNIEEIELLLSRYFTKLTLLTACTGGDFAECHFIGYSPLVPNNGNFDERECVGSETEYKKYISLIQSDFVNKFGDETVVSIEKADENSFIFLDVNIKVVTE